MSGESHRPRASDRCLTPRRVAAHRAGGRPGSHHHEIEVLDTRRPTMAGTTGVPTTRSVGSDRGALPSRELFHAREQRESLLTRAFIDAVHSPLGDRGEDRLVINVHLHRAFEHFVRCFVARSEARQTVEQAAAHARAEVGGARAKRTQARACLCAKEPAAPGAIV